jgi:glycosyltransferase involved in cell wall biosynthesis
VTAPTLIGPPGPSASPSGDRRRILWLGDIGATGFGTVTQDVVPALRAMGHDLRVMSGRSGSEALAPEDIPEGWGDIIWDAKTNPLLPVLQGQHESGWVPQAVIVIGDFFAVRRVVLELHDDMMAAFAAVPTYHYCPIEGVDLPPNWAALWDVIQPVAMSKFGQDQIAAITLKRPPLVYHGVDTSMFRPVSLGDQITIQDAATDGRTFRIASREAAKAFFGYDPRRVMILRTDRHMPRKRQNALIRAMVPVLIQNPQADLVLHCSLRDYGGDLIDQLSKYPPEIQQRIILTGMHDTMSGLPRPVLAALYNAADLYVSISAEGFGLTIAEAIACGTPAVGLNYSSVPEVIGPAGIAVPARGLLDNEYDHFWAAVDETKFQQAVHFLINHAERRRGMGAAGPPHVRRHFQWSQAAETFSDLVEGRPPRHQFTETEAPVTPSPIVLPTARRG